MLRKSITFDNVGDMVSEGHGHNVREMGGGGNIWTGVSHSTASPVLPEYSLCDGYGHYYAGDGTVVMLSTVKAHECQV